MNHYKVLDNKTVCADYFGGFPQRPRIDMTIMQGTDKYITGFALLAV